MTANAVGVAGTSVAAWRRTEETNVAEEFIEKRKAGEVRFVNEI